MMEDRVQQQGANGRLILLFVLYKNSALYQLHLVKAATARAFVPKDLRLVEAFGYTLGGMFLARYHDSPAGQFDEVVPSPPTRPSRRFSVAFLTSFTLLCSWW
jgi:hypothetical protein